MIVKPTHIPDVLVLQPKPGQPPSSNAAEAQDRFQQATGERVRLIHQHQSTDHQGVLRGLHYHTPPYLHASLMQVQDGAVYAVVVDIRRQSPTFGQWAGVELSAQSQNKLWVPLGMAYGHLVLSPQASVVYYTTGQNSAKHTHSIVWDDPDLCIQWPTTVPPTLSAADRKGAFFSWWTMPKDSTFGAL